MTETEDDQEFLQDDQIPEVRPLPGSLLWVLPSTSRFIPLWMREVAAHLLTQIVQIAALSFFLQEGLGTPRVIQPKHVEPDALHQQFQEAWMQAMLQPGILRHAEGQQNSDWSKSWDITSAVNEVEPGDVLIIPVEGLQEVVRQMLDTQGKRNIFLFVQSPLNLHVRFTAGPYDGKPGLLKHLLGGKAYIHINEGEYVAWVSVRDFDIVGTGRHPNSPHSGEEGY